uniref:Secreted protein n=1 Tax=Anopheles darlingi TaxID=43151 RepID=A0A2M4D976_ANODA
MALKGMLLLMVLLLLLLAATRSPGSSSSESSRPHLHSARARSFRSRMPFTIAAFSATFPYLFFGATLGRRASHAFSGWQR